MEAFLAVVAGLASTGVLLYLLMAGARKLARVILGRNKPKLKTKGKTPIAQQDLYSIAAREKALKVRSAANKAQRDEWNSTYRRLIEQTCDHTYDMHHARWWVCTKCFYEKPWYYKDGCSCVTYTMTSYNGRYDEEYLRHRSGTCNVHGRDIEQYKKEAMQWHLKQMKYSKGGIIN